MTPTRTWSTRRAHAARPSPPARRLSPGSPLLVAAALGLAGCGSDPAAAEPTRFADEQVVVAFTDEVVVPTYGLLATRLVALDAAAAAVGSAPTDSNLATARDAWRLARVPWEQSEGFLFGPVDSFGYDPALDSWPVNATDLRAVLESSDALTASYVASLPPTQKGFHTVEYLLFGTGATKTAAELTPRELAYLPLVTAELAGVGGALAASWTTPTDGQPAYRDVFATAGQAGNAAYPSLASAMEEVIDGMIGICDEVANGKIADPYDAHDTTLVESQFALNSLADFQDNLRSVENAYTGEVPLAGTGGRSLSDWVAAEDAGLDAKIRDQIAAALGAIGAIPPPFRDAITTPSSYDEIEAAQAAIRTLQDTLERELKPLVLG
ncbi:MAG: peptidase M75 [Polyangiaceae bacterium]|nr:peptidase M75 [Polyangiaceae bacterium]